MLSLKKILFSHFKNLVTSLGIIYRTPGKSIATITILGFALSLPLGLIMLSNSLGTIFQDKDPGAQIIVFFKDTQEIRQNIEKFLGQEPNVNNYSYTGSDDNLYALSKYLEGYQIKDLRNFNSLPASFSISLKDNIIDVNANSLTQKIRNINGVEHAELDLEWFTKWKTIISFLENISLFITTILAIGATFIIGNITKAAIDENRERISVLNFVGASKAHIRREFLYLGLWRGLLSGALSFAITKILCNSISQNLSILVDDTISEKIVSSFSLEAAMSMIIMCTFIGVFGSWLAFEQYFKTYIKTT